MIKAIAGLPISGKEIIGLDACVNMEYRPMLIFLELSIFC
jgi:hypothetical protein